MAEAQAKADDKDDQNKRVAELERELLLVRAENQQLRKELNALRCFIAETGRIP